MIANVNNPNSYFRELAIKLTWLCRDWLSPYLIAERMLYNVGVIHLDWENGLGCLRGMSRTHELFIDLLEYATPSFRDADLYRPGLGEGFPDWARRETVLNQTMRELADPTSMVSRSVACPIKLIDFELSLFRVAIVHAASTGYLYDGSLPTGG